MFILKICTLEKVYKKKKEREKQQQGRKTDEENCFKEFTTGKRLFCLLSVFLFCCCFLIYLICVAMDDTIV